jgi:hypothetical protein
VLLLQRDGDNRARGPAQTVVRDRTRVLHVTPWIWKGVETAMAP